MKNSGSLRIPTELFGNMIINSFKLYINISLLKLATWKGLGPSTSSVTGWHSNQLNYQATSKKYGGRNRARTYDPLLVRQLLSQLSYATIN